ncbi:hypothetical protein [Arthrobacter sp. Rue61a]|nr:hypothetical protein [Arthrobacter sp. Rue61a]
MLDTPFNEDSDASLDFSMRGLLEEEFRAIFGGTEPIATAWAGLMFT